MNEVLEQPAESVLSRLQNWTEWRDAVPLAAALCNGGLPCAEVTFRTEAAAGAIAAIRKAFPELLLGAGTVLTTKQVDEAMDAGASFIVSPGLNPEVVKYCVDNKIPSPRLFESQRYVKSPFPGA